MKGRLPVKPTSLISWAACASTWPRPSG